MKASELHRKLLFKGYTELSPFLNESPVNGFLYQFMREVKSSQDLNISMAALLNEVYFICIRASRENKIDEITYNRYISEEEIWIHSSVATEMVFCMIWMLLSVQKEVPHPLDRLMYMVKMEYNKNSFGLLAKFSINNMMKEGHCGYATDFTPQPAPVSELPEEHEPWQVVTNDYSQQAILDILSCYQTKTDQRALLDLIKASATLGDRMRMDSFFTETIELIDMGEFLPKIEKEPVKALVVDNGNNEQSEALQEIEKLKKRIAELEAAQEKDNVLKPDTHLLKKNIMEYVSKLVTELSDEWTQKYLKVWDGILDLNIVAAIVYDPGKQQGTVFNRNLVANIIFYLGQKGAFKSPYNASRMARLLEGDPDSSVRAALGKYPDENIVSRLNRFFE